MNGMKWLKIMGYTASVIALLVLLVGGGGALWIAFYDWNELKPQVTDIFETLFGREAVVRGVVEVDFGLEPVIRVSEIVVKNPEWGSRPEMLTIPWLEARTDLFSLWQRKKKIHRLVVSKGDWLLEQNGRGEWNFRPGHKPGEDNPSSEDDEKPMQVYIGDLKIEEGTIAYRANASGEPIRLTLAPFHGKAAGYREPIRISAEGEYGKRPYALEAHLGSEARLWGGKSGTFPIDLSGTLGDMQLKIDGHLPGEAKLAGTKAEIAVSGPSFQDLMAVFGRSVPVKEAFDIATTFEYPEALRFQFTGTKATVGESDYNGLITIDSGSRPPEWIVDGAAGRLDVTPYLQGGGEYAKKTDSTTGRLFPEKPLELSFLKQIQGRLDLQVDRLFLPRLSLQDVTTKVGLRKGRLQVDSLSAAADGGILAGHMTLDGGKSPPEVNVDMKVRDVDLDKTLRNMDPVKTIEGRLTIGVDVRGRGATFADLMADLNGELQVTMDNGKFFNEYLRLLGQNLFATISDMLNPSDDTRDHLQILCLICRFDITDGMARVDKLILDTPQVGLVGDGEINLKTEAIDIPLNTIPKEGVGVEDVVTVSLNLDQVIDAFRLSGTLAQPSISVNPAGALFSVGKTVGSVALFGPAGVAAAFVSGSVGNRNPCQLVLEGVPEEIRRQQQREARPTNDQNEEIERIENQREKERHYYRPEEQPRFERKKGDKVQLSQMEIITTEPTEQAQR